MNLMALLLFSFVALTEASLDPIGALAGVGAVALTELVKRGAGRLDARLAALVKPVQPWIALTGSLLLPLAAQMFGVTVDPQAFAQAPVSTLAFIGAREVFVRLKRA